YEPIDNHLIDCGSSINNSVGDRVFLADNSNSNILSTPHNIFASTSSKISLAYGSVLYQTARILNETSHYTFSIKAPGRHWIRLHFFPSLYGIYNSSTAKFSVSSQNFTFIKEYQPQNDSYLIKEYSLNVTSDRLVLTFTPYANSFAFINALEVFLLPQEIIPEEAIVIGLSGGKKLLQEQALETVARVNMGNETVNPGNDTLWRLWVSDGAYLIHSYLVKFVSNITSVEFRSEGPTNYTAPATVYGTATKLDSELDPRTKANVTWIFYVDAGFEYLVRFHFCDIFGKSIQRLYFSAYINSLLVYENLDLLHMTSNTLGAPYFIDAITGVGDSRMLNVSVGPSTVGDPYPNGILNGLEIMKISNSRGSLDVLDSISSNSPISKTEVVIVGLTVGLFISVVVALVLFLLCRRRKLAGGGCSKVEDNFAVNTLSMGSKYSKFGHRFPLVMILEATNNFSENLVIGIGGFGKVYEGVLKDQIKVAVKRGVPQSQQGLAEFRTELEMLSHLRHRHLVSLIGYCDEKNEMIIIYDYMEKGTLKNHLYGSNLPSLTWRQRLDICIGAARGLHYLHTGSAKAIIHRDVKSANILLDENFMAKVADFGLSKVGPELDQTHVSTAVKGSFGYLDPEYLITQQLNQKSDVYSFGVVMFEVLCGRAVIDPSLPQEKANLIKWAMKLQKSGQLEEIMDCSLIGQVKQDSLKKFGEIAAKCLAEHGVDRPSMGDVLWNLESLLQQQ
ncbi:Pkinase_Tyr domain-containing protein/Malectin_like domain-containing protein, partial [Cephalotus follicularis]